MEEISEVFLELAEGLTGWTSGTLEIQPCITTIFIVKHTLIFADRGHINSLSLLGRCGVELSTIDFAVVSTSSAVSSG